jgi:hypothetical protein
MFSDCLMFSVKTSAKLEWKIIWNLVVCSLETERYLISQACCCCPLVKQCPVKQSGEIIFFKKTIFHFAYHIMNRLQENIRRDKVKHSFKKKQVCFLFVLWLKFRKNSAQTCTGSGIPPWNRCFLRRDIYPCSLLKQ